MRFVFLHAAGSIVVEAQTWFLARAKAARIARVELDQLRQAPPDEAAEVLDVLRAAGRRRPGRMLAADVRDLVTSELALRGACELAVDLLAGCAIEPRRLKSGAIVTGALNEQRALDVLARCRAALGGR